ncbi:MAG: hypothetical protein COV74_09880 [Candidatus Omnitrophica bacterium CG11_big_fil_rev_8_21_14_0_20_45_26]|uniref:Glycosyltransferase 2-like domain-containing protein n=1 Tax=Candidatus Abzuiibacterium crystallinum TaxID=1974748 RepID=A0A2H0LLL8_9BACT|nr:MAG: hypothetical protein COV74_09880 [Candidatus Omnitrophica bacterium CG11_big_fil_rev_8_21_14_0_20_45_26]PIW64515.1 MAG: hypothetical protein COW12_06005 [Candidatus Omnitrophica bacterium CG12_big_fil_rev_8_21_14_0_65_45_16]
MTGVPRMPTFKEKIAFIICTKDRPAEMTELLKSLEKQSVKPFEILVVDGGSQTVEDIVKKFESVFNIRYLTHRPPCLTKQRNLGIRHLHQDATLVAFLDDDLIFEPAATEAMLIFWERAASDLGGASFNITNYKVTRAQKLKSFFQLDAPPRGKLLKSGVGTAYFPAASTHQVEWLCGGATVWRREVLKQHQFDEFYYELGWNEDVDFSYGISRTNRLAVAADARVIHTESQRSRINNFLFGQIQSVNRIYFVKKYGRSFSLLACYWACVGQLLVNLVRGISELNLGLCQRAVGNLLGICRSLVGQISVWVPAKPKKGVF